MIRVILLMGFSALHLFLSAQDYDAELLSYETGTSLKEGRLIRSTLVRLQINNRAGEQYARVSIPYSSLKEISKVQGKITDQRGQVVRTLKRRDISERSYISDMSLYEDDYVKEFTLKHNSYPYTIEYSYQIQEVEFLYLAYWTPVMSRKIPTRSAHLTLSLPMDYPISYTSHLIQGFQIDTIESMIRYTWEADYSQILEPEELAPSLNNFLPSVRVVPLSFRYELEGSFRTWTEFGIWHSGLLHEIQELPQEEEVRIKARISGLEDDREKIRALYHYLQDETRYINVTIETGGLQPYPASYVAKNKYGDCKALSNYFRSVLNVAGIQSYYTKVHAGEPAQEINKLFPSQQFNHIILFIPLEKDTLWLDCTSDAAFGYLGTFTQDREAFVVDENRSRFVRTPALTAAEVLETRYIQVPYDRYSDLQVKFNTTYRGDMYELLLQLEDGYNETEKSRILRNYLMEEGFELQDYQLKLIHRDSAYIQLSYTASTDQLYEHFNEEILVRNIPFATPDFEEPGNRLLPVQIDYPLNRVDTILYELPRGYRLQNSLKPQSVSGEPGEYTLEFTEKENNIQVVKRLLVYPGIYPLSAYEAVYEFFKNIDLIENKTYISLIKNEP